MWTSSLFWKLFALLAGLNALLTGVLLVVVTWEQRDESIAQLEARLRDLAIALREQVRESLTAGAAPSLQRLTAAMGRESQVRVTILDEQGKVLADSDIAPQQAENHLDRPEVRDAAARGYGRAERQSESVRSPMLYVALPVRGATESLGFVRVSMDLRAVDSQIAATQQNVSLLAISFAIVAIGFTYVLIRQTIAPLADLTAGAEALMQGNYDHRVAVVSDDEVGVLAGAFRKLQHDLSRRLRQMQENSDRLATVLASMEEGVIALDDHQRILLANEASRALLDFVTPDVAGRPLLEVTRTLPIHQAAIQALESGHSVETEFEFPGALRRILLVHAKRFPGEPCPGVVVVLRDVTELRRLENLRREFVTNVSHELKTPLASIKAFAETLRLGAIHDQENNLRFVQRIEEQAERLNGLILDLIQIARVEAGQETFEIVEVPLASVVDRCVQFFRDKAEGKNLRLVVAPPAQPLLARADEEGVFTILSNLVDNAVKYTPDGGSIEIRWQPEGRFAVLEVADTGIGISPDHQARVFERFYRVDKARSRELGGTGLGLSIVKHLAQAFGGNVRLSSVVGQGSTFQVRLPLA